MREMGGTEATRRIREMGPKIDQPCILALTAHVGGEERDLGDDAGMDGFLVKPVELEELSEALQPAIPVADAAVSAVRLPRPRAQA